MFSVPGADNSVPNAIAAGEGDGVSARDGVTLGVDVGDSVGSGGDIDVAVGTAADEGIGDCVASTNVGVTAGAPAHATASMATTANKTGRITVVPFSDRA